MTDQEKQQILDMHNQGYGDLEIAKIMFYSSAYISETLRGMGVSRKRGKKCNIRPKQIERICAMRATGMSYKEIGEKFGMSKQRVFGCIKREEKHGRFNQPTSGD